MSLIDLTKKVAIVLEKRNMTKVRAQVAMGMDISGSMQELYKHGVVQETVNRLSAVAIKFDDNGVLDSWVFSNETFETEPVTKELFDIYVDQFILQNSKIDKWGGTFFSPLILDMLQHYFPELKPKGFIESLSGLFKSKSTVQESSVVDPVFAMIVTDGENSDKTETMELLKESEKYNIYWQFVGIGSEDFSFLTRAANQLPNVGFFKIEDIKKISDEDLYDKLINEEFSEWIKKHSVSQ